MIITFISCQVMSHYFSVVYVGCLWSSLASNPIRNNKKIFSTTCRKVCLIECFMLIWMEEDHLYSDGVTSGFIRSAVFTYKHSAIVAICVYWYIMID